MRVITCQNHARGVLLASTAMLSAWSGVAVAQAPAGAPQTAEESAPGDVGEIIVTAQKRSERLRDVPMSVNAATGDQLKTLGVTNLESIGKLAPGFTTNKTTYGLSVFYIRGVGFNDTAIGASPAVSAYTDQLPFAYAPMARGATLDLERVEVLKGPQGTLFGQNATGGAINFIAAKPTSELAAGFDLTYGRFNQIDAEAFVSGPVSDTLRARLAVRNEYRGNWQRGYVVKQSVGEKRFSNARLLVDWAPSDAVKVELLATGWKDRSDAQQPQFIRFVAQGTLPIGFPLSTVPRAPNNARAVSFDPGRDLRVDNWFYQFGGRIDVALGENIDLTSLTSYSKFAQSVPTEFDGTVFPVSFNVQKGKIKSFSQELRLGGATSDEGVKWMIGVNYQDDDVFEDLVSNPIKSSSVPVINQFHTENLQKVTTKSVFGSLDYKVTNTVTVQGAVRYTDQTRDFQGCLFDNGDGSGAAFFGIFFGRPFTPGTCLTPNAAGASVPFISGSLDENNLSWRGGINWKPDTNTLVYANVTKGYKSGSFPTIPYVTAATSAPVKQESVLAYELGAKFSLTRALQLDASLFYYDYSDKQLNGFIKTPGLGITPALVSIPKATIKGAEISATLRPVEGLRISANGTYIDTRIDKNPVDRTTGAAVPPADYLGQPSNYVGLSFANTPKWQGTFDAEYRFPASDALELYVGSTLTYRSTTFGVLPSGNAATDALITIPRYALLDLRAGVETKDGRWRAEAWGRNVTNKLYITGPLRFSDYYTRFTGMPATYGVSVFFRY